MALDAVRPLCLESPSSGGSQLDTSPTEVDPTQDAITAAGLFVNGPTTNGKVDKTVLVDRTNGSLRFTDQGVSRVLGELVSASAGQTTSHAGLLDIIHFLADGPGDGWPSGIFCQEQYSGLLLTRSTWYTNSAMTTPIVQRTYTYNGLQIATDTMTLYNAAGAAVRVCQDTYSYTGIQRTGRTRTFS